MANLSRALYQVWNAIVGCQDGIAQVNLLLNRASPWLDVSSYLPYEGQVVLTNKTAHRIHLRIPRWVNRKAVQCRINDAPIPLAWLNNYLLIDRVSPDDRVVVEFPMVQTTESWTELTYDTTYTIQLKGNTAMDVSPHMEAPAWKNVGWDDSNVIKVARGIPLYRRGYYGQDMAPAKKVQRYVISPITI